MNHEILKKTLLVFLNRSDHEFRAELLKKPIEENKQYDSKDTSFFINDLIHLFSQVEVSAKLNYLDEVELQNAISELQTPFIIFEQIPLGWVPVVASRNKKGKTQIERILIQDTEPVDFGQLKFENLVKSKSIYSGDLPSKYILVTGLGWRSMVSHFNQSDKDSGQLSSLQRLMRLLGNEKKDIGFIYVYAILIGLISMTLPIGVQAIINLISSGQFFNSIIILISLVVLGVFISGGLQIMQMTLVEILQRRIFSKAAYEFAFRIPRLKKEHLTKYYPPELVNHFFEVINIQKGLPKLLIELSAAFLQIVFGLLLLSIYHSFFVVFTGFLVFLVILVFRFTGRNGLDTSLMESTYKYKIVHWLEELSRTLSSFKLAGNTNLPLEKTDFLLDKYLVFRKKHFRILVTQYSIILAFKTLVTAGILVIGAVLVIDRQITLGQFVASELMIIIVVNALEKFILGIDVIYDLLAAVEKLGFITDLPLEKSNGFVSRIPESEKGIEIDIRDLDYYFPDEKNPTISGLNVKIPAGSRFCISGNDDAGMETFSHLLAGMYTEFKGTFFVNGVSFKDLEINYYRSLVSKSFDRSEIFDGSILENITMNKPGVKYEDVATALENLGLMDEVNRLPKGLLTGISYTGNKLSIATLEKIILARCLVVNPSLLIVPNPIFRLELKERQRIWNFLIGDNTRTTIGFVSNDPDLQKACDLVFVLDKGRLTASGPYEEIKPFLTDM